MKKLLFLLLVMALGAGIVFAGTTTNASPGVESPETIMAEYSVQQVVVTQPSALVFAALDMAQPSSYMALAVETRNKTDQVMNAIEKQIIMATTPDMISLRPRITGLYISCAWFTAADFYLRC